MRKVITVSDFSGRELEPGVGAKITVVFEDRRRGEYVADARLDDDLVRQVVSAGRQQKRRGRKPVATVI
jgi:hypothetical protein